jgi:zinc transport system permease protein
MTDFWREVTAGGFVTHALVAVLLANVACAMVGTYVVARRVGHLAGGIAHMALGGMGAAVYAGAAPIVGAVIAAVAGAVVVGLVTLRGLQGEDTIVNALWATGMAAGILFLSLTPGYNADLLSYLFGNVLMVTRTDILVLAGLDLLVVALVVTFGRPLAAVCFDEEFARTRGLPTGAIYLLLLVVVALTVVALVRIVGLILVIALLTLPVATAGLFRRSLIGIMVAAALVGTAAGVGGLAVSFVADVPSGVTIVLLNGLCYLTALVLAWSRR